MHGNKCKFNQSFDFKVIGLITPIGERFNHSGPTKNPLFKRILK